ncbi:MAG: peroxiredoxin [Acidimicrobiia bacterium]
MTIRLGDEAPNFTAESTQGTINLHEYLGDSWGVFFSHPADFTHVCTTELGAFAARKDDFTARNAKLIGLSVDTLDSHQGWIGDIAETQGTPLNYPLLADDNREIANAYGMIHPNELETLTVRSVFIIAPDKKVKLTLTYPASVGRNIDEILRVLDSLQLGAKYPVSTPVNWNPGDEVIIGGKVTDEEAKAQFPSGFRTLKPYLRLTADPSK